MAKEKLTIKQCTQCAAPLPKRGWSCEYCGTSFEVAYETPQFNLGRVRPTHDWGTISTSSVCMTLSDWD
jgi:ribosomal protein L37AE/L43A